MKGTVTEVTGLVKRFAGVPAVRGVTLTARPGRVTGLLGPNGAGKSTTLRMLVGLTRPDAGSALIGGVPYKELSDPTGTVGTVLDIAAAHPAMTARGHLRSYATLGGHDRRRAEHVAELTGVADHLDRRVGTLSTGLRQRLALATALLGDPGVLVLDEPTNGLDPAGIAWMRAFLRQMAADRRTVLVSSHVLTELQLVIDDLVIIDRGEVAWAGTLTELTAGRTSLEEAYLRVTSSPKGVGA